MHKLNSIAPLIAALSIFANQTIVFAAPPPVDAISTAQVTEAKGDIFKRGFIDWNREVWGEPSQAQVGDKLEEGMQLGTGEKSWAQLSWRHITTRAWEKSVYAIAPNQRLVYLIGGELLFQLDKNRKDKREYYVWTNLLQARIRGTTVMVQSTGTNSKISVLEGSIDVENRSDHSIVHLKPGVVMEVQSKNPVGGAPQGGGVEAVLGKSYGSGVSSAPSSMTKAMTQASTGGNSSASSTGAATSTSSTNSSASSSTNTNSTANTSSTHTSNAGLVGGIGGSATNLVHTATGTVSQTLNGVTGVVSGLTTSVSGITGDLTNTVGGVTKSVGNIVTSVSGITNSVGGITNSVGGVTSTVGGVTNSVGGITNSVGGVTSAVGGVTNSVSGLTNSVGNITNSVGGITNSVDRAGNLLNAPSTGPANLVSNAANVVTNPLAGASSFEPGPVGKVTTTMISNGDTRITVFETARTITTLYSADPQNLMNSPLVTSFPNALPSVSLIQQALTDPAANKPIASNAQILRVPVLMSYNIGPTVGTILPLPESVGNWPPTAVIGPSATKGLTATAPSVLTGSLKAIAPNANGNKYNPENPLTQLPVSDVLMGPQLPGGIAPVSSAVIAANQFLSDPIATSALLRGTLGSNLSTALGPTSQAALLSSLGSLGSLGAVPPGAAPIAFPPILGGLPPITVPPIGLPPVTVPPISIPPIGLPPITIPPITVPPIGSPPITVPPITVPPIGVPPIGVPPITVPPIGLPPITVPPIGLPPISVPPITVPPISLPPISVPPISAPPISAPPISVPPISAPPISVPPISVPPIAGVPPTSIPPLSIQSTLQSVTTRVSAPAMPQLQLMNLRFNNAGMGRAGR
ncbi:MAG: FecR domain-containing protein [Cyanobacteria bacterium SZAS-4]|nr:FecR domain-containing protein [Cyanobacteria bacterium SZAS-4]